MAKNSVSLSHQNSNEILKFVDGRASFAYVVFGLLEESPEVAFDSCDIDQTSLDNNSCNAQVNKAFWETQVQLLQATIYRTSPLESKIRQSTKKALKEITLVGVQCVCQRPVTGICRNCLQREISIRLQNDGYNCAICKSKWKSSPEIPAGEHTYLEVVDKSSSEKGKLTRVIIELNFRSEFEMVRPSEEYNGLISHLPEVFVGKAERLRALIKILCASAKKCMKEKNMHLGPWRRQEYMQAKWFGTCYTTTPTPTPEPLLVGYSGRPPKPRASMLTFDLVDKLPGLLCPVVEVV
ncbi:DUF506 domain-containing protein [Cephalotus follicularis]|uniref:DUF506 domain-containing protein n=1 Tax=Cephalotus follicularis TaxID=3775 RepID=A0A1Q3CKJ0_CEPFO|nr:DUF506 domain-containing protein [Cephalotus follicularis]